jgi:AraC-like DNA-binding protein
MHDDALVLALGRRLFEEPQALRYVAHHRVDEPIAYPGHAHETIVQFDLAAGCAGHWEWGAQRRKGRVCGTTAVLLPPGLRHGYAFTPQGNGGGGEFFTMQIELGDGALGERSGADALGLKRVLPRQAVLVGAVEPAGPMLAAFRRLHHLWVAPRRRAALLVAAAAQVLALWPIEVGRGAEDDESHAARRLALAAGRGGIDSRVEDALLLIDDHLADPPAVEDIARAAKLSPRQLSRRFAAVFGCAPNQYVSLRRAAAARDLLTAGRLNVSEVAHALGFSSVQSFSRWFRRETGQTATSCRGMDHGV